MTAHDLMARDQEGTTMSNAANAVRQAAGSQSLAAAATRKGLK
jgi:hypothetical protein